MKTRFLTLFLAALACFSASYSQVTIKGQILEAGTKKGIAYANVYKEGTNIGCLTDADGYFVLGNLKEMPDSLTFQCVGYVSKKVYKSALEKTDNLRVALDAKIVQLKEVTVGSTRKKKKTESLGSNNRKWLASSRLYYASQNMRLFKSNRPTAYIESFSFYVNSLNGNNKARIRAYCVDPIKQTPGSDLLNSNLIVENLKKGWNSVDLSKYNIQVPKDGFFIGLQSVVITKDCWEKVGGRYQGTYYDISLGCVHEQTITARKHEVIVNYEKNGELRLPQSVSAWSLDPPNYGFDLLYKVKIRYYK